MIFFQHIFFHISSPTNLLLVFLEKNDIHAFLMLSTITKISLSAGSFGFLVSHRDDFENNRLLYIPLSCAYALSGYFIAYYHEHMFLDSLIFLPIIIYEYNNLIKKHSPLVYVISLAHSAYCNFYITFIIGIFLMVWFVLDNHQTIRVFLRMQIIFVLKIK